MNSKPECFGVVWLDFIPLSLNLPDAESAVTYAKDLAERGKGKINRVRAVRVPAGEDVLETLWEAPTATVA